LTRKRTVGSDRNPFQDEDQNQAVLFCVKTERSGYKMPEKQEVV